MIKEAPAKQLGKIQKGVIEWTLINVGLLLMAFSYSFFQSPNNFALGGMGGLSIILAKYITPHVQWLTQSVILLIVNVFLILVGIIFLGRDMTIKTIICSLVYSFENYGFEKLQQVTGVNLPLTATPSSPEGQLMLELVCAVLITAGGHALVFNCRASTGGSDIIALIVKKYSKWNIGVALMVVDFLIACISFFTFRLDIGLYSVLGVFAKSFLIDGVIDNITKTKYVTIITVNPDTVKEVILQHIHRGFTKYQAYGGYTDEPRTVIITVCRRSQAVRLKAELHTVDPTSFVIITDANEILGKGFSEKI